MRWLNRFRRPQNVRVDVPDSRAFAPHCDQRVLHAPGECRYCDMYPEWQEYRIVVGIAFTGHDAVGGQLPCPAEVARPLKKINRWGGNVPRSHG